MAKRMRRSEEFKAKVALAAVRGDKTLSELARQFQLHPVQISTWKQRLLERAHELFADGRQKPREPRISTSVSKVATVIPVREVLRALQRDLVSEAGAARGGVVVEGRDITTVVAPDAPVRILLTASEEARLARRSKELHGDAEAASVDATRSQVVDRDRADSTVSQFTVAADGVTTIDTSHLDLEGSVEAVLQVVAATRG